MWILYFIPGIMCIVFLGVSMILRVVVKNMNQKCADLKARCTVCTKATVTGYRSERLMHSDDTWYTYLLLSYCNQIVSYMISVNPRKFPVGTELDIMYNPDNMQECVVSGLELNQTVKTLKLMENLFLAASLVCIALGVVLLPVLS